MPPHTICSVRYALKGSTVSAGQGPDHQVLKHWANLPGEAIRMLLLIIYQMEAGSMPMQALMVYISRIPKPAGGERPIGLTAMLYRLTMRLRKTMVATWGEKVLRSGMMP